MASRKFSVSCKSMDAEEIRSAFENGAKLSDGQLTTIDGRVLSADCKTKPTRGMFE